MFILDSRDTMPTPMMVNLKHEANDIGANFDVDLFSGLPPPASAAAALPEGRDDEDSDDGYGPPVPPPPQQAQQGAQPGEVSAAAVAQALVAGEGAVAEAGEGRGADIWEAADAEEASAAEELDSLSGGVEQDRGETPDVPAVDLA